MTKAEAERYWELYVRAGCQASALTRTLRKSPRRCRDIIREAKGILGVSLDLREPEDVQRDNLVNTLIEEQNIPEEALAKGRVTNVVINRWGNDEVPNSQTKVYYKFDNAAPDFPLIQPADPTRFIFQDGAPRIMRKVKRNIVVSDAQIGRLWRDGSMLETHDPLALEVTEQIIADVSPDELDYIGDWMDWSMLSRWPKKPEYVSTTQQSIQDGYDWHGRLIVAAGPRCKRKRIVKGNHDDRPAIFLRDLNLEAMGLRRASDTTGWPVFSTEFLLRYDELGIEVSDPYPNGTVWLTDDLVLMHAPPKKLEMAASVIHGHTHKLTRETWAQTNSVGRLTFFRYDIGCVAKIDGSVPSDRPRTDWAQGIALVEIIEGKFPIHRVEQIHIERGRAIFEGKLYEAKSPVAA